MPRACPVCGSATKTLKVMLYCHANHEDMWRSSAVLQHFAVELNVHMVTFEYPGYGIASGTASEATVNESCKCVYDCLIQEYGFAPEDIILLGRSIGTGAATHLAANHPVGGIVLVSAFTSIRNILDVTYSKEGKGKGALNFLGGLVQNRFDSLREIRNVACPTVFIHGDKDNLVKVGHAVELHAACGAAEHQKSLLRFPEMTHDNCFHECYLEAELTFIRAVLNFDSEAPPRYMGYLADQGYSAPRASTASSNLEYMHRSVRIDCGPDDDEDEEPIEVLPIDPITAMAATFEVIMQLAVSLRSAEESEQNESSPGSRDSTGAGALKELLPGTEVFVKSSNPAFDGTEATVISYLERRRSYKLWSDVQSSYIIKEADKLAVSWKAMAWNLFCSLQSLFTQVECVAGAMDLPALMKVIQAYYQSRGESLMEKDLRMCASDALLSFDEDKNGTIDLCEFVEMCCSSSILHIPMAPQLKEELQNANAAARLRCSASAGESNLSENASVQHADDPP